MSLIETITKQEVQDVIAATDECVMCGLCLPHCPTYSIAKTESESPRGRIALVRALYEKQLETNDAITSHLNHCLTCMSCERVCPANVDYEKIIDAGRVVTHKQINWFVRFQQTLLLFILSKTSARIFLKTCISIFNLFGLHRLFSNVRLFNLLPKSTIRISDIKTEDPKIGPSIAIIDSCAADLVSDQTLNSTKLILSKLGCNVISLKHTQCCGALHQHTGDFKTAQTLRSNFLHSFEKLKPNHLISLATGCGAQIKRYPDLDKSPIAQELANKLMDVNEFALHQLKKNTLKFKPLAKKVYLHRPCSLQQVANDTKAVEQLLQFIPEIEIIRFEDELACCGAGGMNTITQDKLAGQLVENKIHELTNSSANYLVSSNIGCALHFQAQLKREDIHIHVCHPITLLAQQVL